MAGAKRQGREKPAKIEQRKDQSGLPFSSPGDLPDSGMELRSPILQADFFTV